MDPYYTSGSRFSASCSRPYGSARSGETEIDASIENIRRHQQSTQDLITFLSRHSGEIELAIKQLANLIFLSNYPTKVQWDLVRCTVFDHKDYFEARPHKVATMEYLAPGQNKWQDYGDEDAYGLCIRIQIPDDIRLDDPKVARMRDALSCDDSCEFRFIKGVPFQSHPVYGMYSIELTKDVTKKDIANLDETVWVLSSAVFLPVPETIGNGNSTLYLHHNLRQESGIVMWQLEMDKRRGIPPVRRVRYGYF